MINAVHKDRLLRLQDLVDDSVVAPSSTMKATEVLPQGLPDSGRVLGERAEQEGDDRCRVAGWDTLEIADRA